MHTVSPKQQQQIGDGQAYMAYANTHKRHFDKMQEWIAFSTSSRVCKKVQQQLILCGCHTKKHMACVLHTHTHTHVLSPYSMRRLYNNIQKQHSIDLCTTAMYNSTQTLNTTQNTLCSNFFSTVVKHIEQ